MKDRPCILVVDDSDSLRMAVAQFLSGKGCRVTTASNGVQGLKAIRREPFDVVITDVEMPEHGGVWLWERAVSIQPSLRGRFVFTSGDPSPDVRSMSVFMGAERFSIKPLSLAGLWGQVEAILQGHAPPRRPATDDSATDAYGEPNPESTSRG